MPNFSGNLRDIGLEALIGSHPEISFTPTVASVSNDGHVYATRSVVVIPDEVTGAFDVDLVPTVGMYGGMEKVRVKVSVTWRTDAGTFYDELPQLLDVPHGPPGLTLADIVVASGVQTNGLIFIGMNPPPEESSWWRWLDTSGVPKFPGEVVDTPYLRKKG
ncbi:hypothetical protein NCPPB3778_25 [Rathayibacter phage NCPPB3778]|nr:hypothetical protein NCPPB3778_25 [Rathayibacter phage NCPPB3778]